MEQKNKAITNLTMPEDQKAEMILVAGLHGKDRAEKRRFCAEIGCEWKEYKRLLRKYRQVIERWEAEGGEKDENCE